MKNDEEIEQNRLERWSIHDVGKMAIGVPKIVAGAVGVTVVAIPTWILQASNSVVWGFTQGFYDAKSCIEDIGTFIYNAPTYARKNELEKIDYRLDEEIVRGNPELEQSFLRMDESRQQLYIVGSDPKSSYNQINKALANCHKNMSDFYGARDAAVGPYRPELQKLNKEFHKMMDKMISGVGEDFRRKVTNKEILDEYHARDANAKHVYNKAKELIKNGAEDIIEGAAGISTKFRRRIEREDSKSNNHSK